MFGKTISVEQYQRDMAAKEATIADLTKKISDATAGLFTQEQLDAAIEAKEKELTEAHTAAIADANEKVNTLTAKVTELESKVDITSLQKPVKKGEAEGDTGMSDVEKETAGFEHNRKADEMLNY